MSFTATLTKKVSEGTDTVLTFVPTDHDIMACEELLIKQPITTGGLFVGDVYVVTVEKYVPD